MGSSQFASNQFFKILRNACSQLRSHRLIQFIPRLSWRLSRSQIMASSIQLNKSTFCSWSSCNCCRRPQYLELKLSHQTVKQTNLALTFAIRLARDKSNLINLMWRNAFQGNLISSLVLFVKTSDSKSNVGIICTKFPPEMWFTL